MVVMLMGHEDKISLRPCGEVCSWLQVSDRVEVNDLAVILHHDTGMLDTCDCQLLARCCRKHVLLKLLRHTPKCKANSH